MDSGSTTAEVVVARQPIFDRRLNAVGYELLFRGGATADTAVLAAAGDDGGLAAASAIPAGAGTNPSGPSATPERAGAAAGASASPASAGTSAAGATATVVLNSFTEIGLETVVGSKAAWLNVSRDFILSRLPHTLPAEQVLLEILEDQTVDGELVAAVQELKQAGYRIALDDFTYSPELEPLLALADVVKLDLLALGRDGFSRQLDRLRPYGLSILAEKLETQEDYAYCEAAGCDLFQGYFFCRPELVGGRRIDANRMALLRILATLQDPRVELRELERIIQCDVGLSVRLLRYINSAFFGLRQQVRSIGHALALLGLENLRRWAALSAFAGITDKPAELTVTALIRARFCELASDEGTSSGELFTLGLFSVIDALMNAPIETVLDSIPFAPDVRRALTSHAGTKGRLLDCISALEAGQFDTAEAIVPNAGELYLESLAWADDSARALELV